MSSDTKLLQPDEANTVLKVLYESYAKKLLRYTCNNYKISEDDAWTVVYKTIYKMAEVNHKYTFDNRHKQAGFIFKTHINFLRNYFRDRRSFETIHREVEMNENLILKEEEMPMKENVQLKVLQNELDKLQEWERILLLMRGQEMPYSEISEFVNKPVNQLKVYYARLKKQLTEKVNRELSKLNHIAYEKK